MNQKLNILVIGSGGREHALVDSLQKSPLAGRVYAMPGNPGMEGAICIPGDPLDLEATKGSAKELGIDFCVVGPEAPLAAGLVDVLENAGIPCFGPTQAAAQIEASKVFSKQLMQQAGIPTARFQAFSDLSAALAYLQDQALPLVIKADGLAAGKGVVIASTIEEARRALLDMMQDKSFGKAGEQVIIEEALEGPELSLLCLADGKTISPLLSAMDHKRALDFDLGPNTGGMGAIAPNPFYTPEVAQQVQEQILLPTIKAMADAGHPYQGCLFVGLMLTRDGPRVIEYNARFGDPEAQTILPLLQSDLLGHLLACREGRLAGEDIRFREGAACCLVLTSQGYPGPFETGKEIRIGGVKTLIFFSGVARQGNRLVTKGGRVLCLSATEDSLEGAVNAAYEAAEQVDFTGKTYRRDIGRTALEGGKA